MPQNNDIPKTNQKPPVRRAALQYALIGLAVFLVVVICGLVAVRRFDNKPQPTAETSDTFHETPTTAVEKSYLYQLNRDYNQAYKVLDEAIAKAGNDGEKAALYNEKSIAALNAKDYAFALEMAKESEKLSPTTSSAHIIAESSEKLGDKKTAVEYLKKQKDRMVESTSPYLQEDIDRLNRKIEQLEVGNE